MSASRPAAAQAVVSTAEPGVATMLRVSARSAATLDRLEPLLALRPDLDLVADAVEASDLPMAYRELLAHRRDMTSTLEAHHGQAIDLEPLLWRREGSVLRREVRLLGRDDGAAVEYGAIRIELDAFEGSARAAILDGREPLGSILARYGVGYRSQPQGFFHLRSVHVDQVLGLARPSRLWGRANLLSASAIDGADNDSDEGRPLATVVEILPPLRPRACRVRG